MGKRKKEQQPGGGGGEFHVPRTKRSPGDDLESLGRDGLDATGDADGNMTPAMGRTDDRGQTTAPRSTNGEAAAPGATRPESPQRVNAVDEEEEDSGDEEEENLVDEEEEGSADEAEKDVPGQHGSAGDAETQSHCGTGGIGDGPECLREAAGAAMALPGDTGVIVPVEEPGAHRKEEGERGELDDADQNQEPPGARVVNAEGSECGAASERAAGGETQENGARQPRATGTSSTRSCGSPRCLGVCAPAVDAEGGTTGAESTGKTSGEAAAAGEETGGGETPSPGAGLVPDPAVAAGGSPAGQRDGEAAAVSAAGTDTWPLVCCEGTAETAPAVMVTPVPTSTAEPPGVGTSTAEPPGAGTGTAEPPGVGTSTAEPTGTTEPPGVGTSTAEPPGAGTGTGEPPGVGTSTTEPPGAGTSPTEPTGTTEPPSVGTGTAEPTGTTEPRGAGTGAAVGAETPGESRVAGEPLPQRSELPPQQPPPATDQCDPVEPAPPGWSHNQEPPRREDATDVVCGLILELSNLNRLAMSTHRGLEMLRRPKPRQSRRPVPPRAGRRWKET